MEQKRGSELFVTSVGINPPTCVLLQPPRGARNRWTYVPGEGGGAKTAWFLFRMHTHCFGDNIQRGAGGQPTPRGLPREVLFKRGTRAVLLLFP